jgi:hypothetical protein
VPAERASAIKTLMILPETQRRELLPDLVTLASMYVGAIELVRNAIRCFDRPWLLANIEPLIWRELGRAATYEQYRLLAELLDALESPCLAAVVSQALASEDADIREVAQDFAAST